MESFSHGSPHRTMIVTLCYSLMLFVASTVTGTGDPPLMGYATADNSVCQADCIRYPKGCVGEENIKQIAEKLITSGLRNAGYRSILINGCWYSRKEYDITEKKISYDLPNFPSGLQKLSAYMHSKNLLLGISLENACYDDEQLVKEAETIWRWDVDFLLFRGCSQKHSNTSYGFSSLRKSLRVHSGKTVVQCAQNIHHSGKDALLDLQNPLEVLRGCDSWRPSPTKSELLFSDHSGNWKSRAYLLSAIGGYGFWFDLGPFNSNDGAVNRELFNQMIRASMLSSPLFLTGNLSNLEQTYSQLFKNYRLISINQDGGLMPEAISGENGIYLWSRQLEKSANTWAIVLSNQHGVERRITLKLYQFFIRRVHNTRFDYLLTDVLTGTDSGPFLLWEAVNFTLGDREDRMYIVRPASSAITTT